MTSANITNSRTRYFYTDPLAAAWMGQHFNMVTYIGHLPDDWDAYGQPNWHQCVDDWKYRQEKLKQPAPKFYIHPDSLHLLEPKVGDLIYFGDYAKRDEKDLLGRKAISQFLANEYSIKPHHLHTFEIMEDHEIETGASYMYEGWGGRIIQRNGKPFFWPESEEV